MRPRLARTTLLITAASLIVTALVSAAPPSLSAVRPRSSRSMALPALAAGSEGPCPGPFPPDWHQCGPGAGETCGPDFGSDHCQFHIRDARYGRRSVLRPPSPRSVLVSSVSPPHPTRSPLLTHPHSCGIGDPNGPFYDATHDMYHTFYQSSRGPPCDPMVPPCDPSTEVWGHAASKDLVTWKHLPVAIWNNHSYDGSGVWTGSATIVDGSPVLMFLARDGRHEPCAPSRSDGPVLHRVGNGVRTLYFTVLLDEVTSYHGP